MAGQQRQHHFVMVRRAIVEAEQVCRVRLRSPIQQLFRRQRMEPALGQQLELALQVVRLDGVKLGLRVRAAKHLVIGQNQNHGFWLCRGSAAPPGKADSSL